MYYVYILWSDSAQKFYIGSTEDITKRLDQHNQGVLCKWTSTRGPWQLAWSEECSNITEARKLERWLKRQKSGNGFWERTGLHRANYRN